VCGLRVLSIVKYPVYAIDTLITRDSKLFGKHKDRTYAAIAADPLAAVNIADNSNRTGPLSRRCKPSTPNSALDVVN